MAAENPEMWSEFKSNDIEGMIDELIEYNQQHSPDDRRRILTCGIPVGKIRVALCEQKSNLRVEKVIHRS